MLIIEQKYTFFTYIYLNESSQESYQVAIVTYSLKIRKLTIGKLNDWLRITQ